MSSERVVPVILCGGAGKRLWPLSTPEKPKPFHALTGKDTLFQQALHRAVAVPFTLPPLVVTRAANAGLVREQASALGIDVKLLLEDEGHDTGLAVLLGALATEQTHGPVLLGILAADHHIPDGKAFSEGVLRGLPGAQAGALVVFGVPPRSPSPAYGYILPEQADCVGPVRRFVEKPDTERAAGLILDGARWNSGNFLVHSDALLEAARLHAPDLLRVAQQAFAAGRQFGTATHVQANLNGAEPLSFDRLIVERFSPVVMVPVDFQWSDVGTWDEVCRLSSCGSQQVHGLSTPVRIIGVDDAIVVATPDGILVTRRGQSDALRAALTPGKPITD